MSKITREEMLSLINFDEETGVMTWKHRPRSMFSSNRAFNSFVTRYEGKEAFFALSTRGYKCGCVLGKRYLAHRVIWLIKTGEWPDKFIDHINHNRVDNRWGNLRCVSNRENACNSKISKLNTSGHTGVVWNKEFRKWSANIRDNGKRIHLGYFHEKVDAANARRKAEELYGYHMNHGSNP